MLLFIALLNAPAQFNKLPPDGWPSSDSELDCKLRQLGYKYAGDLKILTQSGLDDVASGLQLTGADSCTLPTTEVRDAAPESFNFGHIDADFASSFYVDASSGSDSNAGTKSSPFKTVSKAAMASASPSAKRPVGVFLRGNGTHYLESTLALGPEHSGVTFTALTGESPVISGGRVLTGLKWSPAMNDAHPASSFFRVKADAGIMVADVPPGTDFTELFLNGKRQIRARWPNGLQNLGAVYPHGYSVGTYIGDDKPEGVVVKDKECRDDDGAGSCFPCNEWIVGGPGARYDPPQMYNDGGDLATKKPSGMSFESGFAKGPGKGPQATWSNVDKAQMQNFAVDTGGAALLRKNKKRAKFQPGKALFQETPRMVRFREMKEAHKLGKTVNSSDPTDDVLPQWGGWWSQLATREKNKVTFPTDIKKKGMWQDQAQTAGDGDNSAFFVENIKEELDVGGEWYLDSSANKLYFKPNSTETLTSGVSLFEYSHLNLSTLVHMQGGRGQGKTVADVAFEGITFQRASPTIMKQYYIPSCGDWSIYRGGAIMIEGGVERLRMTGNVFDALGGNAIFAYGFVAHSNFTMNEFKFIGNSAIAFTGRFHMHDLTGGFYPQDNIVAYNHAHETGLFDIESSFFFESVAGHNQVINNIMYNGPRAAINFNDGGVGGTVTRGNLIFGHGRESSDHGPINSWDRCPFKSLRGQFGPAASSKQQFVPAHRLITRNFVMNGGVLFDCITHDDGASHYIDTNNVLLYGGNQNNNAYYNAFDQNLLIQGHVNSNFPMPGYDTLNADSDTTGNSAIGNTIVQYGHKCGDPYGSGIAMDFGDNSFPNNASDNAFFTDSGKWEVFAGNGCNPTGVGCYINKKEAQKGSCETYALAAWQKQGYDKKSSVGGPSGMTTAMIVAAASKILATNTPTDTLHQSSPPPTATWGQTNGVALRAQRAPRASWSKKLSAEAMAGWAKFWHFTGGPFWTKCATSSTLNDPCSCEMVTCDGTDITALDIQGVTGVQGPVVWFASIMPKLKKIKMGATLSISCADGKAASDSNNGTSIGKATGGWTCTQDSTPPGPSPPGPSPPGPPGPPAPTPTPPAPTPTPPSPTPTPPSPTPTPPTPTPPTPTPPTPTPPTPTGSYKEEKSHSCDGDTIKNLPKGSTLADAEAACDGDAKCKCICQDDKTKDFEIDTVKTASADKKYNAWIKEEKE